MIIDGVVALKRVLQYHFFQSERRQVNFAEIGGFFIICFFVWSFRRRTYSPFNSYSEKKIVVNPAEKIAVGESGRGPLELHPLDVKSQNSRSSTIERIVKKVHTTSRHFCRIFFSRFPLSL
jgi:hypothetical protein